MHNHWIVLKGRREASKVWCCDTTDCVPTNTNSVLPHHTLAPLHWQFLRLFFLSAFCCWDLMQGWALLVCRVPSSSHTGSTLLWFHLDWARAQRHQWRWHLSHWSRPPDHQLFTIHDRLGFQKYNRLSKLGIVPDPVWLTFLYHLYLFIRNNWRNIIIINLNPSSRWSWWSCIAMHWWVGPRWEPGWVTQLEELGERLDNHETLLIHRLL